jgi:hypothetical protein
MSFNAEYLSNTIDDPEMSVITSKCDKSLFETNSGAKKYFIASSCDHDKLVEIISAIFLFF